MLAYRGGFLRRGITAAGILGGTAYLYETPGNKVYSEQWELLVSDKLSEAIDHWYDSGLDELTTSLHRAFGASNVDAPYIKLGIGVQGCRFRAGPARGRLPPVTTAPPALPEVVAAVHAAYEQSGLLASS